MPLSGATPIWRLHCPMANYASSSDDSSDLDEDILSLHQADSQSSHTTLRSNSPVNQGGQQVIHPPSAVASVACEHITELLSDPPRAKRLLKRHKTLVCWGAQIRQGTTELRASGERPSKRRRVRCTTLHSAVELIFDWPRCFSLRHFSFRCRPATIAVKHYRSLLCAWSASLRDVGGMHT